MRALKIVAVLAALGVLAVGSLLVWLWLEHRTSVELPRPTGSFAVGRVIEEWNAGTAHELVVWIWYPAAAGEPDEYLPPAMRADIKHRQHSLIGKFLTRDLSRVRGHSLRNAPLSPRQPTYPVVIMRAGGSAEVWKYSTLAEDLASHGYVVVGFDAPDRTRRPENNAELWPAAERERRAEALLAAWVGDVGSVLDRLQSGKFADRLDMNRVGIFGHSFGGAVAAQFCSCDPRCKAGIDIDGSLHGSVIHDGISRPFMFLLSDHSGESDPESPQIMANIRSVYDRLPPDGRRFVTIRGANHFTFSDDGALLKSGRMRGVLRLFGRLRIDGRRQLAITANAVSSFFDAYLAHPG